MKKTLLIIAAMLSCAPFAAAQTQTVYANNITDAGGNLVASAQAQFTPTVCSAPLSGFRKGGGGQATGQTVYANVVNGAFSLVLPDVNLTYPQYVGFHVVILDTSPGGNGGTLIDYSCVQPSVTGSFASNWCGSTYNGCNFDQYPPNIPRIGVAPSGTSIVNNYNSQQVIDLDSCQGADEGAKLASCAATYAGQLVSFGVTHPATISTAATLGSGQALAIYAPLTFTGAGTITPTSFNPITCQGAGQLINGGMNNINDSVNQHNPFVFAGSGTFAQHVHISGCIVQGGSSGAQVFYAFGQNSDITVDHNDIINAIPYAQHSAQGNAPSVNNSITENDVQWVGGFNMGYYPITVFGAWQNSKVTLNRITATTGGVILFSEYNNQLGATNPSRDQIYTAGLSSDEVSGNVFKNLIQTNSCVFTSTAAHILITHNECDGAGDVGIDLEATVDTLVEANTVRNDLTASMGGFFTQINNVYRGNHLIATNGEEGFSFQNAGALPSIVSNITVEGNDYISPNGIGIFSYLHASQQITWDGNKVVDGVIAQSGAYMDSELYQNNKFHFTRQLQAKGVGDIQAPGYGLFLGDHNDGTFNNALNNTIITDVPQPATNPCISVGNSQSSSIGTDTIAGNHCLGPWAVDLSIGSGSTNAAYPPTFAVRENELSNCSIAITASNSVQPVVNKLNNYAPGGAPCS